MIYFKLATEVSRPLIHQRIQNASSERNSISLIAHGLYINGFYICGIRSDRDSDCSIIVGDGYISKLIEVFNV